MVNLIYFHIWLWLCTAMCKRRGEKKLDIESSITDCDGVTFPFNALNFWNQDRHIKSVHKRRISINYWWTKKRRSENLFTKLLIELVRHLLIEDTHGESFEIDEIFFFTTHLKIINVLFTAKPISASQLVSFFTLDFLLVKSREGVMKTCI